MLPEAAGRGQHFQARGHSFSLYGPTLSRQITYNYNKATLKTFSVCSNLNSNQIVQFGV